MHILVTGGSGFIGYHFIMLALTEGHSVTSVDHLPAVLRHPKLKSVQGSISSNRIFDGINVKQRIDAIVHLAAEKSIVKSGKLPEIFWSTNVVGTEIVLDFAVRHKVNHFVFASSAAVYGENIGFNLIPENSVLNPANLYGLTKAEGEMRVQSVMEDIDIQTSILRFFNVAGANENYRPSYYDVNIFPQAIKSLHEGRQFNLYGDDFSTADGTCVRDYIHVQDVVEIILAQLAERKDKTSNKILNVCTGIATSNLEVVKSLEIAGKASIKISILPKRIGEIGKVVGDNKRLMNSLPYFQFRNLSTVAHSSLGAHEHLHGEI